MSAKGAARRTRIHPGTVYRWLMRADEGGAPECFREFRDRFLEARGKREGLLVSRITSAKDANGNPDWRAAAWLLERLEPEEYGRKDRLELGGDVTVKLL